MVSTQLSSSTRVRRRLAPVARRRCPAFAAAFGWDVAVFDTFWGHPPRREVPHSRTERGRQPESVDARGRGDPAVHGLDADQDDGEEDRRAGTATIEELVELSPGTGVNMQTRQMTTKLMAYDEAEFYDGATTGVGAATALEHASIADV